MYSELAEMQAYSMYTCWINWLPVGDSFFQENVSFPVSSPLPQCCVLILMFIPCFQPLPMLHYCHLIPPPPLQCIGSQHLYFNHKLFSHWTHLQWKCYALPQVGDISLYMYSPHYSLSSIWISGPLFHLTSTWMCPFERCFLVFCYIVFPTTHCGPWLDMQRQLLPKTF